jgi:hypothetical protein
MVEAIIAVTPAETIKYAVVLFLPNPLASLSSCFQYSDGTN